MRALIEQWNHLDPSATFARGAEVVTLREALQPSGRIVELVAPVGMGKTTLLKHLSRDIQASFGGTVEYFTGSEAFPLSEAVEVIAENFRKHKVVTTCS